MKYVTKRILKTAALCFGLYFGVLGLTRMEGDEVSSFFFGRILMVLVYLGTILILLGLARDIMRDRQGGNKQEQTEQ